MANSSIVNHRQYSLAITMIFQLGVEESESGGVSQDAHTFVFLAGRQAAEWLNTALALADL